MVFKERAAIEAKWRQLLATTARKAVSPLITQALATQQSRFADIADIARPDLPVAIWPDRGGLAGGGAPFEVRVVVDLRPEGPGAGELVGAPGQVDGVGAVGVCLVDAGEQLVEAIALSLDQDDTAAGAQRRDHLGVDGGLESPLLVEARVAVGGRTG